MEALRQRLDALQSRHLNGEAPVQQQGQAQDVQVQSSSTNVSLDSLFTAHIKNAQYRAIDFAKLGKFNYANQVKSNNLNLALFSYGSLKHLLALCDGTLPPVDKSEFISRVQHLVNVFELTCLASTATDFDSHGWRVAKEYDQKIINDIEHGIKSWDTLGKPIDAMSWTYAKEVVPKPKPNPPPSKPNSSKGQKVCTTWNTFKKEGICHYEFVNPGESCVYLHHCSKCKAKGLLKRHKEFQCNEPDPPRGSTSVTTSSVVPTTSV